ncbi:hypothetical protein NIES2111_20070 [Nostoc sp. NIES-2111]|nr:hypothetical protein NIES2111_20070 [Nostoc sp. NIES-2111]
MSKHNLLTQAVSGCGIAISCSISFMQGSQAQEPVSFFCDTFEGNYVTKVRTSKGNRAIISYGNWASASGWTAKQRCQSVTSRFERLHEQNLLQYMRTDVVNNYSVICVTPQKGVSCRKNHVLITLKPGTDPQTALKNLVGQSRGDSSVAVSALSYPQPAPATYFSTDEQGNLYVDIKQLIETAAVD